VPIYVSQDVMDRAGIVPSEEEDLAACADEEKLSVFRDFVDSLDLDDLEEE
jgi:hypothetical protein